METGGRGFDKDNFRELWMDSVKNTGYQILEYPSTPPIGIWGQIKNIFKRKRQEN